jgi:hypothetical protein
MEEFLIEDWFREPENYGTITDFLRGKGSPKILIYRQSVESNHISDDFIDNHHHQPSLFLTYGDSVKIKQRGIFFYRNTGEGKTVNLSIANDNDVTFGEIGASPITSLDNIISSAYVPLIT